MTVISGKNLWREKALKTELLGKTYQHLVFLNEYGENSFYFILTTPDGELTSVMQETVLVLLETFNSEGF